MHSPPDPPPEFIRWVRLAGVTDDGAWLSASILLGAWRDFCARVGERPGRTNWFASWIRAAGVAHARRNSGRGFRFRLLTVADVKASLTAAARARQRANEAHDSAALAAAIAAQWQAQRLAGGLLELNVAGPEDFEILKGTAVRWQALARMSDAEFARALRDRQNKSTACLQRGAVGPRTRMVATPWRIDADGTLSRTITAVDVDDAGDAQAAA